jgi:hypothetical protein
MPEQHSTRRRAPKGTDRLRELTLGLAAVPDPAPVPDPDVPVITPAPAARPPRRRKTAPAAAPRPAARQREPMAGEQKPPPRYGGKGAQINLTVTAEQKRALALAQIDDGIETTARIRALIQVWAEDRDDPEFAARIAQLAKLFKGRNAWRG